jgi:inhibitor of cysteine peptidase
MTTAQAMSMGIRLGMRGCPMVAGVMAVTLVAACGAPNQGSVQVGIPRQVSSPSEPASFAPRAGQWPSEVQARIGQPVMIRLPGTAGTGYTWQLSSPVCAFLPLAFSQQLESSTDGRVGGPSEWVFTFTAEGVGTCNLSFQYHRPWERGVAPVETRTVVVTVVAE